MIKKYYYKVKDFNDLKLALASFLALFLINLLATIVSYFIFPALNDKPLTGLAEKDYLSPSILFGHLFKTVLLAPLLETLIFQMVLINGLILLFKRRFSVLIVLIASLFFALGHFSSINHIARAFLIGIVLNTTYYIVMQKSNNKKAFLIVFIVHAAWNLFSALLFTVLKDI